MGGTMTGMEKDVTDMETERPAPQTDRPAIGSAFEKVAIGLVRDGLRGLLRIYGGDSEVIENTPDRFLRWLREASGASASCTEKDLLGVTFRAEYDEMIVLREIRFASTCEHHLLPFTGTATVGYLPREEDDGFVIVGLSKLARLVHLHATRIQLQERLTWDIADAINTYLEPRGVGVVIRAKHSCVGCRGARQPDSEMVTSAMLGALREIPPVRSEFLALARP